MKTTLRSVGGSRQKASYLHAIAEYFGEIKEVDWNKYSDKELTSIKGVGSWTAKMVLIFTLARNDVFAHEDLGVQIASRELFGLKGQGKSFIKQMEGISANWVPYYRSFACRFLWAWKNGA